LMVIGALVYVGSLDSRSIPSIFVNPAVPPSIDLILQ